MSDKKLVGWGEDWMTGLSGGATGADLQYIEWPTWSMVSKRVSVHSSHRGWSTSLLLEIMSKSSALMASL